MLVKSIIFEIIKFLVRENGESIASAKERAEEWSTQNKSYGNITHDEQIIRSLESFFSVNILINSDKNQVTISKVENLFTDDDLQLLNALFDNETNTTKDDNTKLFEITENLETEQKMNNKRKVNPCTNEYLGPVHKKTLPTLITGKSKTEANKVADPILDLQLSDSDSDSFNELDITTETEPLKKYFPVPNFNTNIKSLDEYFVKKINKINKAESFKDKTFQNVKKATNEHEKAIIKLTSLYAELESTMEKLKECTKTNCKQHSLIELNSTIKKGKIKK